MRHRTSLASPLISLLIPFTLSLAAGEMAMATDRPAIQSTLDDQRAVAVTIYNNDLALIKDQRRVTLPVGRVDLALRDVSARIKPQTALLRGLDQADGPRLIEQNFDFDLLTPAKLLEKFVGREVALVATHPTSGEDTEETAVVLAANDGVVLRVGDRIEAAAPGRLPGRIVFRDIPANLRDRPTLTMTLDNAAPAAQTLELSYLTSGLSWAADYVGELNASEDRLDLTGWVTLENRSGASYRNARLQLVAGDVNQVESLPAAPAMDMEIARLAAPAPPMAEESLFEYHLYSLAEPTTIADQQSKQVALLGAGQVGVGKELLIAGDGHAYRRAQGVVEEDLDVQVFIEIVNDEASNLGVPLPAGTVRIYKRDSRGNAQFIGEDAIEHTPINERVRLRLGQAFDVTAKRRQSDFKKLSGTGPWQYQFESAFALTIRNAKPETVQVVVQEPVPGDWTMLAESHPHEKANANIARWRLEVPAEGSATLDYRVRVRF